MNPNDSLAAWPTTTALDRPTRVLLALTQTGEELEAAAATLPQLNAAELQRLLSLLQRLRLGPWVAHQLTQMGALSHLDPPLCQALDSLTAQARQRALRLRLALLHTVRCLRAEGLEAVPLKGAQLAWQHYPQPWLRPMRDLDLLLPEEQIAPAFALLEREGFRVRGTGTKVRRPDDPLLWRVNDFCLGHPSGVLIDLHRSLWFRPGDICHGDFSLDPTFWSQAQPYRQPLDAHGLGYLRPAYLSLHCLVHHLIRANLTMGPLGLVDLQQLESTGHLPSPELTAAAELLGFSSLLTTALGLLADWRHTRWLTAPSVPSWVLPLLMSPAQNLHFYLDHRSLRSHALEWLAIQARGGRWSGPAPAPPQQLLHLARALRLLPQMATKAGVLRQMQRRLGIKPTGREESPLPAELVTATRVLQARTRDLASGLASKTSKDP